MDLAKKRRKGKGIYIILSLLILIIIALSVLGFLYFTNEEFKNIADTYLKTIPFLESITSRSAKTNSSNIDETELNQKKEDIAEYYIKRGIDAVYELYAIKTKDELLYSDIVKIMNQKSPSLTSKLITEVRNLDNMEDILTTIHNKIMDENKSEILEEARKLENMELLTAIEELNMRIKDSSFIKNINDILLNMREESLCNIFYYMDEETRQSLYNILDEDLRLKINSLIKDKSIEYNRLVDIARLYEDKPVDILLNYIGNTDTYDMDELAVIYSNLSVVKSGEVLSKVNNDAFIQDLIAAISKEEQLRKEDSVAADLNKAIQFITEYNAKIDELVNIYENMEPNRAARILENMLENSTTLNQFVLESEPVYEVTDSSVAMDILKNMRQKNAAKILNYFKTENVTKLTQMLASP
ncbi:MAG TPA: hypothetical protein GXX53_08780 [Tissierellia bacterium]|nr:hypothetical protein [Tissierellia bacterium]